MFERLQKLNITVSHQTVIDMLNEMGNGHDKEVLDWHDKLNQSILVCNNFGIYIYIYIL